MNNFLYFPQNSWTQEEFDTRNVVTFDVLIVVKDVQDTPPIFIGLPNVVHLSQDIKTVSQNTFSQVLTMIHVQGDLIVKLKAEDGDYGSDQKRNISYLMPGKLLPFKER